MFLVSIVSVLFIKIKVSKRNTFNEPSESIFSLKVLNLFSKSWIAVPQNDFRASKTLSSEKAVDNPWLHLQFWLWNQKHFFSKYFPKNSGSPKREEFLPAYDRLRRTMRVQKKKLNNWDVLLTCWTEHKTKKNNSGVK